MFLNFLIISKPGATKGELSKENNEKDQKCSRSQWGGEQVESLVERLWLMSLVILGSVQMKQNSMSSISAHYITVSEITYDCGHMKEYVRFVYPKSTLDFEISIKKYLSNRVVLAPCKGLEWFPA